MTKSLISIVVPIYNEEEVIPEFMSRLSEVMKSIAESFEVIFVDDGSTDESVRVIREYVNSSSNIRLVRLSRNFGKEIALTAGIDQMKGDCVIFIDADLQDPPELIIDFVKFWKQGIENVYGLRVSRSEDTRTKRTTASLFYRAFNLVSGVPIPPNAGDFRLLGKNAAEALKKCREKQRFMKGLYSWVGFSSLAIPYERPARFAGKTSFSFGGLLSFALDGIIAHSSALLRVSSILGLITIICSMMLGIWLLVDYLLIGGNPNGFYVSIIVSLGLSAVNLIMIGVLGEYVWRIFEEVKDRPLYIIKDDDQR